MLFNSYEFIFIFLPITLILYFTLGYFKYTKMALGILVFASLAFYAYWDIRYLPLLIGSILFNYFVGALIGKTKSKKLLIINIFINFALLGYFKYAGFFVKSIDDFFGASFIAPEIILPLGISFFTFTQTAFLVDAYRGEFEKYDLLKYSLFVTVFPHLIAGPILHHGEMMPQFNNPKIFCLNWSNICIGITIFFVGLFKKVIIADRLALIANPIFNSAFSGSSLDMIEAWLGALAYSLQLYFDFSGYSEMAIGLALLFNLKIPINFFSPYKAKNIIDFWRRWHITLSEYLKNYLYIPLGGNRKGQVRRYINLLATMLLGGLWHGAGWNFIIWGALHGVYLTLNHLWRHLTKKVGLKVFRNEKTGRFLAWLTTFIAVVMAWVFFRANDVNTALSILRGMFGANGISLNPQFASNLSIKEVVIWIAISLIITLKSPNIIEITGDLHGKELSWKPSYAWAIILGIIAGIAILGISQHSEFLYFQF